MLVHTSVEKGFVYHLQFQNEASNGSFRLECNKSMFEGFLWVYWVPPSTLCIPCLSSPGLLTHVCISRL